MGWRGGRVTSSPYFDAEKVRVSTEAVPRINKSIIIGADGNDTAHGGISI